MTSRAIAVAATVLAAAVPLGPVQAGESLTVEQAEGLAPPPSTRYFDMARFADLCRQQGRGVTSCKSTLVGMLWLDYVEHTAYKRPSLFCVPANVDLEKLRRAVISWVESYPTYRRRPAVFGVVAAVREAYPCHHAEDLSRFGDPVK